MAVVALARIVGATHQSPILAMYREHPGLQQRLGSRCRVSLSFGLHYGWAIEGAVGSEFKIDASYLSPNVSIATSIECATGLYKVPILATQAIIEICNREMATKCRVIDKVNIKGSKTPLEIYSIDLDPLSLKVDKVKRDFKWNPRERFRVRQHMETQKAAKLRLDVTMADIWEDSQEMGIMRHVFSEEFLQVFNMGYQNYSEGEWKVAKTFLERTETMLVPMGGSKDGPSGALLRFMENSQFEAPHDWKGIHDLVVSETG
jgi:hypothetical protein